MGYLEDFAEGVCLGFKEGEDKGGSTANLYWAVYFLDFAVSEAAGLAFAGAFAMWDLMLAMFSSWHVLRLRSIGMRSSRASPAFRPASLISSGLKPLPWRLLPLVFVITGFMWCILLVDSCVAVAAAWAHAFSTFSFMVEASDVFACAG